MRKPKIQNKYNLKPKDITKAIILDRERITKAPFWRNTVINAWCLNGGCGKGFYGEWASSFWIGIYDDDAKAYTGKIRLTCSAMEGMCNYNFKEFYNPKEIENETDLELQEKLLKTINWLIDEKIIAIPNNTKEK